MSDDTATPRSIVEVLGAPQTEDERAARLRYWIVTIAFAGLVGFLWFLDEVGPGHPAFALLLTAWTHLLTPVLAVPAVVFMTRHVPARWFRVPVRERLLHRAVGVGVFGWILERSGYNRQVVDPLRRFRGTRSGLRSLESSAQGGAIAHGTAFSIHLSFAVGAFLGGYRMGALWILLPGVVFHLYPVLLQRSIMLRIQPLLDGLSDGSRRE